MIVNTHEVSEKVLMHITSKSCNHIHGYKKVLKMFLSTWN